MSSTFECGRYSFELGGQSSSPLIMGILNVTPDSFSDGGAHLALGHALDHAEQMIVDGVDIIDVGAESTRPGATPLSLQEELDRVMPVLYALRDCGVPLSVDTYKPTVMREALHAGVDMINDINAFREEGAIDAIKESACGLCLMHMQGAPQTMQDSPQYLNVVKQVCDFLQARTQALYEAGIAKERITIDPGFGFGKTLEHNVTLLQRLHDVQASFSLPVLAGLSRKGMLGTITGRDVDKRQSASVAAALIAMKNGASILRVHDVAATIDAVKVWNFIQQ